MPDLELQCVQCDKSFSFSEQQQETFYRLNMPQPQRCGICRPTRKKLARAAENPNGVTRHEIVCDRCGKKDFVPFLPKAGRTVLCANCHGASRARTRFA